jgi:undecaprenyl-diphosphatase
VSTPAASPEATGADTVPGTGHFGPVVDRFDTWVDDQLEHLRGHPLPDLVFTSASHVGDFSVVWHTLGGVAHLGGRRGWRQSLALSSLLGLESLVVNQGVKRLFDRNRPTTTGDERYDIRTPSTTSFPSGHASSAFFAATVLTTWGGRSSAPLWYGIAAVVATSRAYVRIHHASDVIAGAALGLGLGLAVRPLVRRLA